MAILELQQFRMMQLPIIIIDDILHAPVSSGIGMAANGTPWNASISLFDSFQTKPPAQAPSPSPSHAWALDGGTKEFKDA